MKKRKNFLVYINILLLSALFLFQITCTKKEKKTTIEKKIPVEVFKAKFKTFNLTEQLTGEIRPLLEVNVYPKIPGKIIKNIFVATGKKVNTGEVIAEIETDTILAQYDEAKAGLDAAKAQLEIAKKDLDRLSNLYEHNAIPKQKLDHQESGFKLAKANVQSLKAKVKQLNILFKNHKIHAPISGFISMKFVDKGALTNPMQPIVKISKINIVKIIVAIPEKIYPLIKKGTKAIAKLDAYPEKIFTGKIAIISPVLDPRSRTGSVEININNNKGLVLPGMFANVELLLKKAKLLIIPEMALLRVPGTVNYFLFVVNNGIAERRNVTIGKSFSEFIEIKSGLSMGDKVVQIGQHQLKENTLVLITNS